VRRPANLLFLAAVVTGATFTGTARADHTTYRPIDYYGRSKVIKLDEYYGIRLGRHRDHEDDDVVVVRAVQYPNGINGPVFDTPYPLVGCVPRARAYIFDHSYDPDSFYCRGWRNRGL
jgi:hypothetical protein